MQCPLTVLLSLSLRMMPGENNKSTSVPEEELLIRKQEEELFASIAAPPKADSLSRMMDDEVEAKGQAAPKEKKQRPTGKAKS